jgi:hypothetical protein
MLVFGEAGQPSAPLQQFARPSAANPGARIRTPRIYMPSEFQPYNTMMPQMVRLPKAFAALQSQAGPGAAPTPQPDASVPTAAPNGMPSPVQVRAQRMLPPHLVQALGIIPFMGGRGGRPSGKFDPSTLTRNPMQG